MSRAIPTPNDPGFSALAAFADEEFHRLSGGYDAGIFYGAKNQIARYWQFLEQIFAQHSINAHTYRELHAKTLEQAQNAKPNQSYPVSREQVQLFELYPKIDLEIQSYYLFAKILLGAASQMIGLYFGPARDCSTVSHDQFRRSFAKYQSTKQLSVDPAFPRMLERLFETIVDHRDKQYEHYDPRHRPHIATTYQISDAGEIIVGQIPSIYPDLRVPEPRLVNAESLHQVRARIDEYFALVVQLLEANRERTALQSARPNPGSDELDREGRLARVGSADDKETAVGVAHTDS